MFTIYGLRKDIIALGEPINCDELSLNPHDYALDLLEQNPEYIHWENLMKNKNPRVITIMRRYPQYINWELISGHCSHAAIKLLRQNLHKIVFHNLYQNTCSDAFRLLKDINYPIQNMTFSQLVKNNCDEAVNILLEHKNNFKEDLYWSFINANDNKMIIDYLLENPNEIQANLLCVNKNPRALDILENIIEGLENGTLDKENSKYQISSLELSENPCDRAIDILEKYPKYISYPNLALNTNPRATKLLLNKLDSLSPSLKSNIGILLSYNMNPSIVNLLLKYNVKYVSNFYTRLNYANEGIFEIVGYNYEAIKERMSIIEEELMARVWHPSRVMLWAEYREDYIENKNN
jgi:hypothetical protein